MNRISVEVRKLRLCLGNKSSVLNPSRPEPEYKYLEVLADGKKRRGRIEWSWAIVGVENQNQPCWNMLRQESRNLTFMGRPTVGVGRRNCTQCCR
jgi:hypothetical protein